jgi:pyroglutamyl-peptidase
MEHISVVISGFDPYEGVERNPSLLVPRALAEEGLYAASESVADEMNGIDVSIEALSLPVSFELAWSALKERIDATHPDIVIATGLKQSARGILLERCANNLVDSIHVQYNGADFAVKNSDQATRQPIASSGPASFWTRLPLRAILDDFAAHGIPSTLSSDAGTFVCNSLFYNLMTWAREQDKVLAGFVNLPIISEERNSRQGLPMKQQIEACRLVVRQAVDYLIEPSCSNILIA